MKRQIVMSLLCVLLMTILTSCAKEVHGINLQWIVIPLVMILIVAVGIVIVKNYKSIAEEKRLTAEMARRQKIFAEEAAEKQKQLAAGEVEKDKR
jgi:hypothetical protein